MHIGGLQKTTLIDYPGKIACTVFTVGCNFRCPWCYSSELVLPEKIVDQPEILEQDFFDFLEKRKGQVDGVVICGGEPTMQADLPHFCERIKKLGYVVKLDTNGSNCKMLKQLIDERLIDYIAMDIKGSLKKYPQAIGHKADATKGIIDNVLKSVELLKQDKVDYEFRTTFTPKILDKQDILDIAEWLTPAKKYYIQNFRAEKNLDPDFIKIRPYSDEYVSDVRDSIVHLFEVCEIR